MILHSFENLRIFVTVTKRSLRCSIRLQCIRFPVTPGWVAFALVTFLALSGLSAVGDEIKAKSPAQEQFEQGATFLKEKNYSQAEASFKKAIEVDPKFVLPYLGLSDVDRQKGDMEGASSYLQKALALAPNNAGVQTAWGQFLFAQKRFLEAEKAYQRAIQIDPQAAAPKVQLGDLYLVALKKPAEATIAYREALALDPSNQRTNLMLGVALLSSGDLDQAEKQLTKACDLGPNDLTSRKALADLQLRRGEVDSALENYRKALQIDSNAAWATIGIGNVFMGRQDYSQAINSYRNALTKSPKSIEAQTKLGMAQELSGDLDSAEASYKAALALDPKDSVAANNLAWLLAVKKQKPKEALPWAQKAVATNPKNANFLDTLGWIMRANGDVPGALTVLKKAQALAPQDPGISYHLGLAYQESGNPTLAAESFMKALAINTSFSGASDAQSRLAALQTHK